MSIWKYLFSLEERRNWWLSRVPEGPLKRYYETPFPEPTTDWRAVPYVAVDYETTGLDQLKDEILSIGFAEIRHGALELSTATHFLVKPTRPIPKESAVIHGIMDDEAEGALSLEEALPLLLHALAGKVMLAHHAGIEYFFLDNACRKIYGYPFIGPVVDTLALEVRSFRNRDVAPKSGELRLANARTRYGLPRYQAHNALIDGIAAGELFLAQVSHMCTKKKSMTLKQLSVMT